MKHEEWQRYRRQAWHSLDSARRDQAGGDHDWACFKAQQAAELALKGYLRATREYATGHSVMKLLGQIQCEVPPALLDCARELDKVYIPARYPDAYDWGSPMDYYQRDDSGRALACAESLLRWLDDRSSS